MTFNLQRTTSAILALVCWLAGAATVAGEMVKTTLAQDKPEQQIQYNSAEAQRVLEATIERYRGLKSYGDRMVLSTRIEGDDDLFPGFMMDHQVELQCMPPGRFAIVSDSSSLISDGKTLWAAFSMMGQYTETALEGKNALEVVSHEHAPMLGPAMMHPVVTLMVHPKRDLGAMFPMIKTIDAVRHEPRDGNRGQRLSGTMDFEMYGTGEAVQFSVWIAADSGLIHEIVIDATQAYREMSAQAAMHWLDDDEDADDDESESTIESAELVLSLEKLMVNGDVKPDAFVFKPNGETKVNEFSFMNPMRKEQLELIGKAAPDFDAAALDGGTIKLSAYRGQVVVLDFWATWCGPCIQALPSIQKIADHFKGRNVAVLGVNSDHEGAERQIRRALDKKKIDFPQILDPESKIGKDYAVGGIPYVVIIDPQGIVQSCEIGGGPAKKQQLIDDIELLLKGEDLYDPADIAERIAEADSVNVPVHNTQYKLPEDAISEPLEEVHTERFTDLTSKRGHFMAFGARHLDVDFDGDVELVLPGFGGATSIIDGDGSEITQLRFEGAANASVSGLAPVRIGGETHWFVAHNHFNGMDGQQRGSIALYDHTGQRQWTYAPQLDEEVSFNATVAAGDLDGDHRPELVAAISTHKVRKMGGSNHWNQIPQGGYIVILDTAGNTLAVRKLSRMVEGVYILDSGVLAVIGNGKLKRVQFGR